ncbi:hypothetical protein GUJ93_ZPchr0014g46658 [Zizania palustris]|uniref:Uncharacterized protein n=1 Tax=Zizania palustris TaxID=103762 RepID=A0A8J5SWL0_ZIZPA|nr:hypothetical protein GUJ93_ZPchr0014g46658 [Zizania palustris]
MPRHALAATVAKKPEEIAAPPPAPPATESSKGAEKAEKKPKEAAKELEAESSEMKPEKDTTTPAPVAPLPSTPPQARPTVAIGGFAFVPVGSLATDQPPGGVGSRGLLRKRIRAGQVKWGELEVAASSCGLIGRGRAWKRDSPEASPRRVGTTRVPKLSPEVSSQRTGRTKVPSVNLEVSHHRAVAAVRLLRIEKGKAFVGILLHQFHFVQEGLHLVGYHYEMALLRSEEKISLGAAE